MNLRDFFICAYLAYACAETGNSGFGIIDKILNKCQKRNSLVKCLKVQALKIADRALRSPSLGLTETISIVRHENNTLEEISNKINLEDGRLEKLDSKEIDELLFNTTSRFLSTHRIQVDVPILVEEGRGKKKKSRYPGFLMAGLAIKGFFLAMAYKGIAVMSGTAILIGKMALLLSALLGLKKLINSGPEKTTFEIVKHPIHSESHSHTISHEVDDHGHYYRALGSHEDMTMQDKQYRGHVPRY